MIYEIELLEQQQLDYILKYYKKQNFANGSLSNPSKIKNNLMMKPSDLYNFLNQYCSEILLRNSDLFNIFVVDKISPTYFLWYGEGMQYGYHVDDNPIGGVNAHYSMTCFLSDPDEYEGGELVLKIGTKEIEYKLKKGSAVVYPTGIKHKVNPVKSGDRKVFVSWMQSAVSDYFIRNHLIEYGYTINQINLNDGKIENGQELIEDLEQLRINLMREYARFH